MSASQPETHGCFFPADTILDSGRVLRKPIREWSHQLSARIRSCACNRPELAAISHVCSALNNAALVFVHAGLPEVAEDTCQSQLTWIDTFRGVLGEADLTLLAIHPWVNLGRLLRRSRDYEGSLRYFLALHPAGQPSKIQFGRSKTEISEAFREVAEPLYVYESMRTHMQSGELDRTVTFANSLPEGLLRSSHMLKTELLLHVHLRRGDLHQLLPILKEMPWPEDQFGALTKHFYSALALNAMGQSDSCGRALDRMKPYLATYLVRSELDARNLRFVVEACRLAVHLNRRELFLNLLSAGCAAVLRARDVPMATQLLRLGQGQGCAGLLEELTAVEEFVAGSGYQTSAHLPMSPGVAEALSELRGAMSQLLNESARALCA